MATVVPRLKKRRVESDADPAAHAPGAAALPTQLEHSYTDPAGLSTGLTFMQAPMQPLPPAYVPVVPAPAPAAPQVPQVPQVPLPTLPPAPPPPPPLPLQQQQQHSVHEIIGGEPREVFIVSDDDDDDNVPPAAPLRAAEAAAKAAGTAPPPPPAHGKRKADFDGERAKRVRHDAYDPYEQDAYRNLLAAQEAHAQAQAHAQARWAFLRAPAAYPERVPLDDKEGHLVIRTGDFITPRYQICEMLGQGTFGKVVRCYDHQQRRAVAIKVIRAIQKYRDASRIEIRVLRCIREHDPSGQNLCVRFFETLDFHNHVCIVSELLGRSVFDFLKDNEFQPFACRDIWLFARQILRSVTFLHDLSLVHTDLKPENVLLVDSSFDTVPTSRRPPCRLRRVLRNADIRLIDFGSATFNDEYHSGIVSTRHYRAPEVILGMGWSFPCDVWSIGCILVEFFTGDALFQTHDDLEHLAMMERVLGRLPDDYRRKAETYMPDYFVNGQINYPNAHTHKKSRRYVQAMKRLEHIVRGPSAYAKHNELFLSLLHGLLEYDTSKRLTAREASRHPYFDLAPSELPS